MYGQWSLEAWSTYLLIVGVAAMLSFIFAVLWINKEQRKALGKSGWFDRSEFTEYTVRKLAAHLITVGGILVIGLGVFVYQQGGRVVPWIIGVAGLAISFTLTSVMEDINEKKNFAG